jgi:DNA replication ATP-dependent helicase Dna2
MVLFPLTLSKKFIMFGDYFLYNPPIKSVEATKGGMGVSLFRKLSEKHP